MHLSGMSSTPRNYKKGQMPHPALVCKYTQQSDLPQRYNLDQSKFFKLNVNGNSVHCYLDGPEDGPRILFIHGFGFMCEMYAPFVNQMIKKYRVLSLDLPGHGSTQCFPDHLVTTFVDCIASVAKQKGFDDFSIVGHSMGGLLTIYCSQSPVFKQFKINEVVAYCPAGIKIIASFGQKMVKANCCIGCMSHETTYTLGQKESHNRSFSQMPEEDAESLKFIFSKYCNTTQDKINYSKRTIEQVQGFPWDECQEQYKNASKMYSKVYVFLSTSDKYIDYKTTKNFIDQNCPNMKVTTVTELHEYPIVFSDKAFSQLEAIMNK